MHIWCYHPPYKTKSNCIFWYTEQFYSCSISLAQTLSNASRRTVQVLSDSMHHLIKCDVTKEPLHNWDKVLPSSVFDFNTVTSTLQRLLSLLSIMLLSQIWKQKNDSFPTPNWYQRNIVQNSSARKNIILTKLTRALKSMRLTNIIQNILKISS